MMFGWLELVAAILLYASNSTQFHSFYMSLKIMTVTLRCRLLISPNVLKVFVDIH